MLALRKRRRASDDDDDKKNERKPSRQIQLTDTQRTIKSFTIRDQLLQREVMELNPEVLPVTVRVLFPDPNTLHEFFIRVTPNEGLWLGGLFDFNVHVPETYNMSPPKVKCLTPVWHPNIQWPGGEICLSLLRVSALDDLGWTPTRHLKDVVLGLDGLFNDLVNFEDPLNKDAAEQYYGCRDAFRLKARSYIQLAKARASGQVPRDPSGAGPSRSLSHY